MTYPAGNWTRTCRKTLAIPRALTGLRVHSPRLRTKTIGSFRFGLNTLLAGLLVLAWAGGISRSASAAGQPLKVTFDEANKLYEQGKFTEAAGAYERLLTAGQASAAVYYNLGNAWFKAGQIGRALAAYHEAEQITPRDPDLRANLQFARNQVQGPTLSQAAWQRWLGKLSLDEWSYLAGGAVWLWFLLLTLAQWRPGLRASLRFYIPAWGVLALLFCALLGVAWRETRKAHTAIVVSREAVVRQGPIDESPTAFTVHDGAELKVLDRKENWLEVSTAPRRLGWIRSDQTVLVPRG